MYILNITVTKVRLHIVNMKYTEHNSNQGQAAYCKHEVMYILNITATKVRLHIVNMK